MAAVIHKCFGFGFFFFFTLILCLGDYQLLRVLQHVSFKNDLLFSLPLIFIVSFSV